VSDKVTYKIEDDEFVIKNYNKARPFASFFPGIAGAWGKPMWIFYVNRAQGISCMGTRDKNGAIMEFLPANKAYRMTSSAGFRTFIKVNGRFYEPFQSSQEGDEAEQYMHISAHSLKIRDINLKEGIEFQVEYFTIPNETVPSMVRILTIRNIRKSPVQIVCIDGLPMINPFGSNDHLLKNMSRLGEGWFSGVEFTPHRKFPLYKLSVEPEDRPEIVKIRSANFYAGFYFSGDKAHFPDFIVDPDLLFGPVNDFSRPYNFLRSGQFKNDPALSAKNKTPCGFGSFSLNLKDGAESSYFSIIGNVRHARELEPFITKMMKKGAVKKKYDENRNLIRNIGSKILTGSSSEELDNYTKQTFLDNLLRGGYPITIGLENCKKNYYIYSRIHGDMEREYNNFVVEPQYFSQGTGNYRDVNQNRRSDLFFNPELGDETLIHFTSLIQLDGFNPLKVLGSKFKVKKIESILSFFKNADVKEKLKQFFLKPFSVGAFFDYLEEEGIKIGASGRNRLLEKILCNSEKIDQALHGEGFWSDHWHYNIDLIESFIGIFPDRLSSLFLKKKAFTFYDNSHVVQPRSQKYVLFNGQPRQLGSIIANFEKSQMIEARKEKANVVRTAFGKGSIYKTTLLGKLLSLTANKYGSLDPEGVGIEMEAGKSNWCDALNGLPGIFGSSLAETLELKRLMGLIQNTLEMLRVEDRYEITTAAEIIDLLEVLEDITKKYSGDNFKFWDRAHDAVESYRKKTLLGVSGKEKNITVGLLKKMFGLFLKKVNTGIQKAFDPKKQLLYTNFENKVVSHKFIKTDSKIIRNPEGLPCIRPMKFSQKPLPLFLEGPVHYLRTMRDKKEALLFHRRILKSGLYDKKLKMLKVNEDLKDTSINVGRIKIFTRGWLENESIWLHMEYKYLLELLKNGLTDEFYKMMRKMLVPFMDPARYGRSIFENVSFIVSSAYPEEESHGQGFVSRLSGATAEFLSMWIMMTSGLKPFFLKAGKLYLQFSPQLAEWLFTSKEKRIKVPSEDPVPLEEEEIILPKNSFLYKFLGHTLVIYHNEKRKNIYNVNQPKAVRCRLAYHNGRVVETESLLIGEPYSRDIRNRKVKRIDVWF